MPEIGPRVVLLVPVYNRREITREFLVAARKIDHTPLEVVVVDDGSPDGTADMIKREFPEVRLLRTPGDYWWSKCMNAGLRAVLPEKPDYILTLNDDVSFDPSFLRHLVDRARREPRTLVGSMIYYQEQPDRVWYAGGKIGWIRGELLHRTTTDDGTLRWLTGMGVLIPSEVFAEVGLYDEKHFPQYVADAELSMRARARGYRLALEPLSRIWNRTQESSHVIDRQSVTLKTFLLPFRSIRSAYEFRMRRALYRLYWPAWLMPVALSVFVARVLRKQTTRLILSCVSSRRQGGSSD
jgi:GT2 family glycosyltransferase